MQMRFELNLKLLPNAVRLLKTGIARHASTQARVERNVPKTMRAILADGCGGIMETEQAVPEPKPDEHLLRVRAVGLNRADLLQIAGKYPPPEGTTNILGLEAAGYIQSTGQPATSLLTGGALAEYTTVPKSAVIPLPSQVLQNFSMSSLAAIPEAFLTAYHTLFQLADLQPGETVLINAAGSGVGTAAIQLARRIPHVHVIATARTPAKLHLCSRLGAQTVVSADEALAARVAEVTNGLGTHVVLDCVGAHQFRDICHSVRMDARWVLYGLLSGGRHAGVSLSPIVIKRIRLMGTSLRGRSPCHRADMIQAFADRFASAFAEEDGLRPVIHAEFSGLGCVQSALDVMRRGENFGKVVVTV